MLSGIVTLSIIIANACNNACSLWQRGEGKKNAMTLRRHAGALPAALCGVRHENEEQKVWKEEKFIFWFQLEAVSNVTKAPVNKLEISSCCKAHFHPGTLHKQAWCTSWTIYSHLPLSLAFPHPREWKVLVAKHGPTDALTISTFTPIRPICLVWGAGGQRPARAADQSVACFLTDIRGSTTREVDLSEHNGATQHRQKHQINSSQTNPENPAALTDWHLSCLFTFWFSPLLCFIFGGGFFS